MVIPVVNYQAETTRVEDDCVSKNFSETLKFLRNLRDSIFDIVAHSTLFFNTLLIPTCSSQLKDIHTWLDRQVFSLSCTVSPRLLTICDYGGGYNSSSTYPTIEQGIKK